MNSICLGWRRWDYTQCASSLQGQMETNKISLPPLAPAAIVEKTICPSAYHFVLWNEDGVPIENPHRRRLSAWTLNLHIKANLHCFVAPLLMSCVFISHSKKSGIKMAGLVWTSSWVLLLILWLACAVEMRPSVTQDNLKVCGDNHLHYRTIFIITPLPLHCKCSISLFILLMIAFFCTPLSP